VVILPAVEVEQTVMETTVLVALVAELQVMEITEVD
jgi:hypothetical protein